VRVLAQVEIENEILAVLDALEDQTHLYDRIAVDAASAEADYKLAYANAIVRLSDSQARMTAPEKQARAELHAADELRAWKVLEARRASTKEALLSVRARLDALRSLSANVRHQS
jgi:hypothetical protein